ncbi:MocR-like pyridoxine biosynthesis transcription factor PdxR [Pseudomonas abietaniphila]
MKKNQRNPVSWSLPLDPRLENETLQAWLYRSLRKAILDGRLPRNHALLSTRYMAAQHGLARGTVQAAYNQLLSEGYLVTARGSGTRVSLTLPDDHHARAKNVQITAARPAPAPPYQTTPWANELISQNPAFSFDPLHSSRLFVPHTCDVNHFPVDQWRRLHLRHLGSVRPAVLTSRPAQGLPALRQAIAEHLAVARGVAVSAENIVIVSSVQQGLDLCLRLLIRPGDKVWMEDPGYPGAKQMMTGAGAEIVNVPVDEHGMVVEDGVRLAQRARFAYVTPCRQAPTGVALAPERRLALLQWAKSNDAYIFEDDYDSEYRFVAKPIPALRGMPDAEDRVVMAGTFSKLLFPAVGLAYLALPSDLVNIFTRALSLTARHANGLAQAVLADFMSEGHFGRHIRRMRKIYASRARAFEQMAATHWDGLMTIPPITAGLDIVGTLVDTPEFEAIIKLRNVGIGPMPLSKYTSQSSAEGLVMGFAAHGEAQIEEVIIKMAKALG